MMDRRSLALLCLALLLISPLSSAVPGGEEENGTPGTDLSISDEVLLHLKAGTFDPAKEEGPGPSWLRDARSHPYYIIQFDGPIQSEWRDAAVEAGIELLDYLPDHAYFARIPRTSLERVRSLDHVRFVGPAHLAYRVDPSLWGPFSVPVELEFLTWSPEASVLLEQALRFEGAMVLYRGHEHVTARLYPALAILLARDPSLGVAWIEPKYWPEPLLDNDARTANARQESDGPYQSNDEAAWAYNSANDRFEGWTGRNVTVSVADSGLDDSHPAFAGRIVEYYDYGNDGHADYHGHGTHCSGIVLGNGSWRPTDTGSDGKYSGLAPGAGLVVQEVFNNYYGVETYNRDAARSSATICSNSWGYGEFGAYYSICKTYDDATRDADSWRQGNQPILFTFSAGNDGAYGLNSITPPATAKNIITVGATGNDKFGMSHSTVAGFSSRGPTDDGRLKPDVVMPGHQVVSARSTDPYACRGWSRPADGQSSYVYASGTSMAAPGVAGAAAVVTQYLRDEKGMNPSPAMLKASLINGARPLSGYEYPGHVQGWGLVDLTTTLFESDTYRIFRDDQSVDLDTLTEKKEHTYWFMVWDDAPLKVTLVWTDPGANPSASIMLVNDLDLVLTDPDGRLYAGNLFESGQSFNHSGDYADRRNNVEGFLLDNPKQGIWQITVSAYSMGEGPQDFALVVSGHAEKGFVDLSPTSIVVKEPELEEWSPATLEGTLKNLGNRAVGPFGLKVETVAPDGTVTVVAEANESGLGGGRALTREWTFTGQRGVHKLRMTVDPLGMVVERNETNNVVEGEFFFKGYDVRLGEPPGDTLVDPGQLVQLNVSVLNDGNVADDIRVSISAAPPGWTTQLVADTLPLEAGESGTATVNVIAPSNATAGEPCDLSITALSLGNTSKSGTIQVQVVVDQVFGLEVGAKVGHLELIPGASGEFTIQVSNPGNGQDRYELLLPADINSGWWGTIPDPYVPLEYRSSGTATVNLTAPNPSPAGTEMTFSLTVRSTKSGMEATVVLGATVLQFYDNDYAVAVERPELEVGASLDVPIEVINRGNGLVDYVLSARWPDPTWSVTFDEPVLEVRGYSTGETTLRIVVPERAISQDYRFTIAVVPTGGQGLTFDFNVTVLQFHDLEMELLTGTHTVTQGEALGLTVRLNNLGNGWETAKVLVTDLPPLWTFDLVVNVYDIEPLGTLDVTLVVNTHKETPGGTYDVPLLTRYGPPPEATSSALGKVHVLTRPDLRLDRGLMNVSSTEILEGDLVQLSTVVENGGQTTARDVLVQFYLDGNRLGQAHYVSSLEPGERVTLTIAWVANVTGYHELSVRVDPGSDVDEYIEDNNMASAQVKVEKLEIETSPGFGAAAIIAALLSALVLGIARRRRRS